jgi:hypothetical protein
MEALDISTLWNPEKYDKLTTQTYQFQVTHTNTLTVKSLDFSFDSRKGYSHLAGVQVASTEIAPALRTWFGRFDLDNVEVMPVDTPFQFLMSNAGVPPMARFWKVKYIPADGAKITGRFFYEDKGTDVYRIFIGLVLVTPKAPAPTGSI